MGQNQQFFHKTTVFLLIILTFIIGAGTGTPALLLKLQVYKETIISQ